MRIKKTERTSNKRSYLYLYTDLGTHQELNHHLSQFDCSTLKLLAAWRGPNINLIPDFVRINLKASMVRYLVSICSNGAPFLTEMFGNPHLSERALIPRPCIFTSSQGVTYSLCAFLFFFSFFLAIFFFFQWWVSWLAEGVSWNGSEGGGEA